MNNIKDIAKEVKQASFVLADMKPQQIDAALRAISRAIMSSRDEISGANAKDLKAAKAQKISSPLYKRLVFDEEKLEGVVRGLGELAQMQSPIGRIELKRELDEGLILEKITSPIGVIGVIFEARPDALVQIAGLALKSGNCAILKGGSEAFYTNAKLFDIIYRTGLENGLPERFIALLETRDEIGQMLRCHEDIDLIIPRGSNEFVRYIMENSSIPVMGHSDGICHIYVDKLADIKKAIPIILDSKTQYVAACNAVESLLIHKDIATQILPPLAETLHDSGVELRGDRYSLELSDKVKLATHDDFRKEYLDYILSVSLVDSMEVAVVHINTYGSHHTDVIISEDAQAAEEFLRKVDSASVYHNCSTRFADGYRYGFGAEVGISTGKLHARGPVGLDGLTTYKYTLRGLGQTPHIVEDYASGKRQFRFKDI